MSDVLTLAIQAEENSSTIVALFANENNTHIHSLFFLTMDVFRQRLLKSAMKQSDLIEIFAAIDRGRFRLTMFCMRLSVCRERSLGTHYIGGISSHHSITEN
jgi:hypothetical protein